MEKNKETAEENLSEEEIRQFRKMMAEVQSEGIAEAGKTPETPKEETAKEYVARVMRGEMNSK